MAFSLKYFVVVTIARFLRALRPGLRVIGGFFEVVLFPVILLGKLAFRFVVLPLYQVLVVLRLTLIRWLSPAERRVVSLLSHRFAISGTMAVIVLVVSIFNIRSHEVRAEAFGANSLLYSLVNGDASEEYVEEVPELQEAGDGVYSYIGDVVAAGRQGTERPEDYLRTIDNVSALVKPNMIGNGEVGGSTIPSTPSTPVSAPVATMAARTQMEKYTVQSGDTIEAIAKKFGISTATVLSANNLSKSSVLHIGDVLSILPVSGVQHVVRSGETLLAIAQKYGVDVKEIQQFNKLSDASKLAVGESIMVPGGSAQQIRQTTTVATTAQPREKFTAPVERIFQSAPTPASSQTTATYAWPTSGHMITQYFGYRHTGVDLDGEIGAPIYAMADGTVEFAGWATGYGLSIVINHGNGLWSRYGHNSKIYVRTGDTVTKGQSIALMGTTGKSTGSHLHFEVFTGPKQFKNPLKYIK